MRFCAITLGCKVNQYETQAIEGILSARGHERALPGEGCDVCIINTCAVTAESVRKSRRAVRYMKKLEPGSLIAVCGCFSQLDPEAAKQLGADFVGGSGGRGEFALLLENKLLEFGIRDSEFGISNTAELSESAVDAYDYHEGMDMSGASVHSELRIRNSEFELLPVGGETGRTRALLKIQDGCDNFCAYCIIPFARGRSRSLPIHYAAENASRLEAEGFREIVVTGIEISSYGIDLQSAPSLIDLILEVSAAAPKTRIRLGSLDPGAITQNFCEELALIPNLCDHFHLSLQSGCDETLSRMGRRYGTSTVMDAVSSLRRQFGNCGITADLIVGFPGETEEEFEQSLSFIKTAAFSGMHIFPFSTRPGTRAASFPDQIEKSIKIERARIAAETTADMANHFMLRQIGKTLTVLFETERSGLWFGHSSNYLEVAVEEAVGKNSLCPVLVTGVGNGHLVGNAECGIIIDAHVGNVE